MFKQCGRALGKRACGCVLCAAAGASAWASAAEPLSADSPGRAGVERPAPALPSPPPSGLAAYAKPGSPPSARPSPFASPGPQALNARGSTMSAASIQWAPGSPGPSAIAKPPGGPTRPTLNLDQPPPGASLRKWMGEEKPEAGEEGKSALRLRIHRSSVKLVFSGSLR